MTPSSTVTGMSSRECCSKPAWVKNCRFLILDIVVSMYSTLEGQVKHMFFPSSEFEKDSCIFNIHNVQQDMDGE